MLDFQSFEIPSNLPDSSETVQISSLALLKMLIHAKSGIPLEVMGLIQGEFIDEYTIKIVDVFAMPQAASGIAVEAMDHVFQIQMTELLEQTGRTENVIGWYHSHPGFGCWLSNVDMSTQSEFEKMSKRAIAVVIDPVQSVKGRVVIEAFRLTGNAFSLMGSEPRQITSNIGFYPKSTLVALLHGLQRQYYNFHITYKNTELEKRMLCNLNKKSWIDYLTVKEPDNGDIEELLSLTQNYIQMVEREKDLTDEELKVYRVGKVDYRKHILEHTEKIAEENTIYNMLLSLHSFILE
ncbi:26S proteasome regulatory subunit RPN11 [Spraguea lophii 42_110]|uniref:26S proteasome regulatory subunit RPN11 n=1 Tax=Spraguea lophii (strain 42_110) TaxID=1358809 RepID=S7XL05_SPRLO|nr:26S proteasome regulatory subunit RPN11 [Spraguea lophii 42_110]